MVVLRDATIAAGIPRRTHCAASFRRRVRRWWRQRRRLTALTLVPSTSKLLALTYLLLHPRLFDEVEICIVEFLQHGRQVLAFVVVQHSEHLLMQMPIWFADALHKALSLLR